MANKKATQFATPTDAECADGNNIWIFANPTSGKLYKPTASQLKKTFQAYKTKYVTTGSEDDTLTISAIAGKEIIAVYKEGQVLYEVDADPDEVEFIWDDTNITLGQAIDRAGIRFLILYKTK